MLDLFRGVLATGVRFNCPVYRTMDELCHAFSCKCDFGKSPYLESLNSDDIKYAESRPI